MGFALISTFFKDTNIQFEALLEVDHFIMKNHHVAIYGSAQVLSTQPLQYFSYPTN